MATTRVYLELGTTWVFASALEWPGWCRRGKGEQAALDTLLDYVDRYAVVAGPDFLAGEVHVVGRIQGNATTDFGAPAAIGAWDDDPLDPTDARRLARLLSSCWRAFDEVVATAAAQLRPGPRGGGRDRDAIVDHVREAERSYGRKVGLRLPPRTPWTEQRAALVDALQSGAPGAPGAPWPAPYAFRRLAWHVLDHAWEIEDRTG